MKVLFFVGFLFVIYTGCEKNEAPILSANYEYVDLEDFRKNADFGEYEYNIKTTIIRRVRYKLGVQRVIYDSTLNEYLINCVPISGYNECPYHYQYFITDLVWQNGSAEEKLSHRAYLQSIRIGTTFIENAWQAQSDSSVIEPSIQSIDEIIEKTILAKVNLVKEKMPSHDGINHSIRIYANIEDFYFE